MIKLPIYLFLFLRYLYNINIMLTKEEKNYIDHH